MEGPLKYVNERAVAGASSRKLIMQLPGNIDFNHHRFGLGEINIKSSFISVSYKLSSFC
jgi:hypothetical protein